MNLKWLIETFVEQPIVESASIVTLSGDAKGARVQISRWVSSGVLVKLRRGYYILAKRYRKREPDPLYIANVLCAPSYVSLEYALGHYGLIPEAVAVITSVTTRRPQLLSTKLGRFEYRHMVSHRFFGYETLNSSSLMPVQIALPEKALIDLIYFTPGQVDERFFESIRLQNLESLDATRFSEFAARMGGRKMQLASRALERYRLCIAEEVR